MNEDFPAKRAERPGGEFLWIIEAQFDFLDRFCLLAGLERDSAVPLVFTLPPNPFAAARLTYPGAKCRQPEAWLKVLGLLFLHHIPFKLYQATGQENALTYLAQLRPPIDRELEELLGLSAHDRIQKLRSFTRILQEAFAKLEKASTIRTDF